MTALPQDVVADLSRLVAELEDRLDSSFVVYDHAIAQQALLAQENARLQSELATAGDREAASAEILRTISEVSGDAERSLQQIVEITARLFGASSVRIRLAENVGGGSFHVGRSSAAILATVPDARKQIGGRNLPGTVLAENRQIHVADLDHIDADMADWPGLPVASAAGTRTISGTPLRRGGNAIGALIIHRDTLLPFTEAELALQQSFADQAAIAVENARLFNETQKALARQTATSDILRVISQSPTDVQPVFDAIVRTAVRLLGCDVAALLRRDGAVFSPAAEATPEGLTANTTARNVPIDPDANFPSRAIVEKKMLHLPDYSRVELPEHERRIQAIIGVHSALFLPLLREDECIGVLALTGKQPRTFSESEIALAESYRDQALIAIENVRLFNETREALERQTATADILKVIASSPSDVQPVFDAIATSANRLLGGFSTTVFRFIDGLMHLKAFTPTSPTGDELLQAMYPRPLAEFPIFELVRDGETAQFADTEAADVPPAMRALARSRGFRSMLFTPLINSGLTIGMIGTTRPEPGAFAAHHVQLLQTFADQAVIAIENVRLFDEVQSRTNDLSESLEQQTATSEVLKVISRSAFDLDSVLGTLVTSASTLCDAEKGVIFLRENDFYRMVCNHGFSPEFEAFAKANPMPVGSNSTTARAAASGVVVQAADVLADPTQSELAREYQRLGGYRTNLGVPLRSKGETIGIFTLTRQTVRPFNERQIELVQTFADQAVIAIENVRLFDEVQARTRDLTESLQQQTATADVLKVISRSAFDLQMVLETLITSAVELSGANRGSIFLREGDVFPLKAASSTTPEFLQYWAANPPKAGRGSATSRVIASGKVEIIPDVLEDPEMQMTSSSLVRIRAALGVPMLRDNKVEGVLVLTRPEPGPFTKSRIDLVQTFADQAVIAVENVRLFDETQARTKELAASLEELRTAQDRLVQTEKLASLGQLTAGIAHEIKNPLNFVNNFSSLSAELTDELNDVLKTATLADKVREEVDELTGLLKDNLQKVVQHGKRADSIVKNMLLHSREGSGDHRPADINALLDESLNLAYHGARAEKPQFNVTLQRNFDPNAGMIDVFPQEITRVFLNLVGNGFYAVSKRKAENADGFDPVVSASTKDLGDHVEIRIRDNGTGIPPEVKEKMFNPFFTTKPAGEGTGLGLSMSHDIIVKQHNGTIDVETEPGLFTEFTVVLPRAGNISNKNK
jgi:GAF domain-containing protein